MPSPSIDRITVRSAAAWIVVLWAGAASASAQSRCVASRSAPVLSGSIGLVPGDATTDGLINEAIAVWRSCGTLALNLAHELGHVLGLIDAPDEKRCEDRIMADLSIRNLTERRVSAEECRVAGRHAITLAEQRASSPSRAEIATPGSLPALRPRLP